MTEPDNFIEAPKVPDMANAIGDLMDKLIDSEDLTEEDKARLLELKDTFGEGMQNLQDAMEPFVGVFDARLEAQEKALRELIKIVDKQQKDLEAFEDWAKNTLRPEIAGSFLEFADLCEGHGMPIPPIWRANLQKVAGK